MQKITNEDKLNICIKVLEQRADDYFKELEKIILPEDMFTEKLSYENVIYFLKKEMEENL